MGYGWFTHEFHARVFARVPADDQVDESSTILRAPLLRPYCHLVLQLAKYEDKNLAINLGLLEMPHPLWMLCLPVPRHQHSLRDPSNAPILIANPTLLNRSANRGMR